MPAESSRAVFLSYASQDAEAARRICEALRAGGVEVWFDADGGLEHGDEWDAISWIRGDTLLKPLHSDPRWPAFLKKIGLTDEPLQ
jgi:hypothetical protein